MMDQGITVDRRSELLEAFFRAWLVWCADANETTEAALKDISRRLQEMDQ